MSDLRALGFVTFLGLVACGPKEAQDTQETGDPATAADPGTGPGAPPAPTSTGGEAGATTDLPDTGVGPGNIDSTSSEGGPGSTSTTGLETTTDGAGPCSLDEQDCPEGQKCNVYAPLDPFLAGGQFTCVPLHPDPKPPGAPCTVFEDPFDGTDDCALGSICYPTDDQGQGTCVEICKNILEGGNCSDPGQFCVGLTCQTCTWSYCASPCDLLDPNACPAGEVCVHDYGSNLFTCVLDASGEEGQAGDPCEYENVCDPAHLCINASSLVGCEAPGCCSPACDLGGPDTCPDQDMGVACQPFYEDPPSPDVAHLGVCALPLP